MNCLALECGMDKPAATCATTSNTLTAIREYVMDVERENFTTHDIARHMGIDEYHVRVAFGWLTRKKAIEIVPCVKSTRYTRTRGEEYSAAVYRLRKHGGMCDFAGLMRAFFK